MEGAWVGQTRVVKGELILQPAQKDAEGARARYIAADLHYSFLHIVPSVSIEMYSQEQKSIVLLFADAVKSASV